MTDWLIIACIVIYVALVIDAFYRGRRKGGGNNNGA